MEIRDRKDGNGVYREVFIFFNDLNDDAKAKLLKTVGAEEPSDMNWDMDLCPIALFAFNVEKEQLVKEE